MLLNYILYYLTNGALYRNLSSMDAYIMTLSMASVPVWLYFIFFESSSKQGTLGKQLLQLKVVDMERKQISFFQSFLRNGFKLIPFELNHYALLFPSLLLFDPKPNMRSG